MDLSAEGHSLLLPVLRALASPVEGGRFCRATTGSRVRLHPLPAPCNGAAENTCCGCCGGGPEPATLLGKMTALLVALFKESGVARHRPVALMATVIWGLGLAAPGSAAEHLIDTRRSTVTVHVFAPAVADALADHHLIQAPLSEGTLDNAIPHFQIVIDGSRLRVLDPGRSARERRQLQSRMLGPDVLDVNRFRWISFHSVTSSSLPWTSGAFSANSACTGPSVR